MPAQRPKRSLLELLGDLRRMVAPLDVLYAAGHLIYRRALRYTMLTASIAAVGLASKALGLPGFTFRQAVLLPLLIGALSLTFGILLKVVPSMISSRLMLAAQASDLNLMEDYRKSQTQEHLQVLWDRLYQYECRLQIAAEQDIGKLRKGPLQVDVGALARAKGSFLARANEALCNPLPQIQQMFRVGLDLRFFEDWRDGAYLDRSDSKLVEQFDGNSTLTAARDAAGLTGLAATMLFNHRKVMQKFWFTLITRMVAIQTAGDINKLCRRYDTDLFNSQMLLWPGTEDGEWLDRFPGAREELLRRRRRGIRRTFGRDIATARCVLDHMLYCSFAAATELRMRYDPDYCGEEMGYDVVSDLTAEGKSRRDFQRAKGYVARAQARLKTFEAFCKAHRSGLLAPTGGLDYRIARVAVHTDRPGPDRKGLQKLLEAWDQTRVDGDSGDVDAAERVGRAVDDALRHSERYTRRLMAVRLHHELTRLSRQGYAELIEKLGYQDEQGR
jgi:hypothetical protein